MRNRGSHVHIRYWRGTFRISYMRPKATSDQALLFEELGVKKHRNTLELDWQPV